jgi:hypothetical protein
MHKNGSASRYEKLVPNVRFKSHTDDGLLTTPKKNTASTPFPEHLSVK